jgi:hypothetical protein
VRDRYAKELKIDPAVLGARHILSAVATAGTLDAPNMREWQKQVMGDALLAALQPERNSFIRACGAAGFSPPND